MGCFSGPTIVDSDLVLSLDAANLKSYSRNVHPQPLDLYTWYFNLRGNNTGNNCTVARDLTTSVSPVGGVPMRMDITGLDAHIGSYSNPIWNLAQAKIGEKWICSVYAKATATMRPQIFIFGDDDGSGYLTAPAGCNADITTEWSRVYFSTTFTNAATNFTQVRLDGQDSGQIGQSIWFDGLQLERIPTSTALPTEFTPGNGKLLGNDAINLVGSNSKFPLINGIVYNDQLKALDFDAVDDYIDFNAGTLGSVITITMLAKFTSLNGPMPFGFNSYDVFTGGGQLGYNTAASDRYGLTDAQTSSLGLLNNWKYYTFVMFNDSSVSSNPYTNNKIYVNGIEQVLSQTTGVQSSSVRSFTNGLGRISGWLNNATQYKMPMSLGTFSVHNRQLTDIEIQQNFEATRSRYGI